MTVINSSLQGKVVFVTGASRGIGAAIARVFYGLGATVVGGGITPISDDLFSEFFCADFSISSDIKRCYDFVKSIKPDILINNAGINKNAPFVEIDLEDFQRIQQVNLITPLLLCQAALPGMSVKGWGRIVNISSIWGKISRENRAAYSASKFALDGMTIALAAEYAKSGILVNCVAPGFTDTELTKNTLSQDDLSKVIDAIPIGRMANVEEIASLVAWLGGLENTYITGQNIAIDGGFTRV